MDLANAVAAATIVNGLAAVVLAAVSIAQQRALRTQIREAHAGRVTVAAVDSQTFFGHEGSAVSLRLVNDGAGPVFGVTATAEIERTDVRKRFRMARGSLARPLLAGEIDRLILLSETKDVVFAAGEKHEILPLSVSGRVRFRDHLGQRREVRFAYTWRGREGLTDDEGAHQ